MCYKMAVTAVGEQTGKRQYQQSQLPRWGQCKGNLQQHLSSSPQNDTAQRLQLTSRFN